MKLPSEKVDISGMTAYNVIEVVINSLASINSEAPKCASTSELLPFYPEGMETVRPALSYLSPSDHLHM